MGAPTHSSRIGRPGHDASPSRRTLTCAAWPAQRQVTVPAGHFVPEDAPAEFAAALRTWLGALGCAQR